MLTTEVPGLSLPHEAADDTQKAGGLGSPDTHTLAQEAP